MSYSPLSLAASLEAAAVEFLAGPGNDNGNPLRPGEKAFGQPIFGYAAGADLIWETFKTAVDPAFLTPKMAFSGLNPEAMASELWVMVFVLPQTGKTMREHNRATQWPSEGWVRSRYAHPKTVDGLALRLVDVLAERGVKAVVPDLSPGFKTLTSEAFQIASTWSHRHAGFAAGLGTFGLCDGLITKVGKAHRMGSLIVNHPLPVTERDYGDHEYHKHCLWFNSGSCGLCVARCPVGAITLQGRDKTKCAAYLKITTPYIEATWPDLVGGYACGLCQSRVPCAVRSPKIPTQKFTPKVSLNKEPLPGIRP
ncbi:MAG: hypothetical protein LBI10_07360 [Deltaproteobacteria bacterium]|jgi:ferredoxin|nr:hypothetical protein [Deltaproteobacteria bacterium]